MLAFIGTGAIVLKDVDWLCYHCWREYERACRKSNAAGKKILKEIGWMKDELEKRAKIGGY